MRNVLFFCIVVVLMFCLETCHRDMSVDTPIVEIDGPFSIQKNQFEFSNYQVTAKLVLENPESKAVKVKIKGVPDWLSLSDTTGILQSGLTTLILTVDTTRAVPVEYYEQITFENKAKTEILYYSYTYLPPLPSHILAAANQFIITWVGKEFFNTSIKIDKHKSRLNPPIESCRQKPYSCAEYLEDYSYIFIYYLKAPNVPEPGGIIQFYMDTTGTVFPERNGYEGLPDCVKNPGECQFPISEADALEIARNELASEIKSSFARFFWSSLYEPTFIWEVRCTIYVENPSSATGFSPAGKVVVIDANSGQVIAINGWFVIP